jgi:hypothetical protein
VSFSECRISANPASSTAFSSIQFSEVRTMLLILLIIVLLMTVGAFPRWPYSRNWGYYPSGGLTLILIILLILLLAGY